MKDEDSIEEIKQLKKQLAEIKKENIKLEKTLADSKDQDQSDKKNEYKKILDTAKEGFWYINEDYEIIDINQAMCSIIGFTKNEIIGNSIYKYLDKESEFIIEKRLISDRLGYEKSFEVNFVRQSGRKIPCLVNLTHFYNKEKEITGHFALVSDITKLKIAEKALYNNRQFLDAIINNSNNLICSKDLNGKFLLVNKQWEILFGIKEKDILGKTAYELFPSKIADAFHEYDDIIKKEPKPYEHEVKFDIDNQSLHFLALSFPLFDADGKLYAICGIATEITKLKEAEMQMRIARDAAQEANKAKSNFLASMSHEIRTPMNAILGFADLLNTELENKQFLSYTNSIITSGKSLLGLINDLLDLSKIEAGKLDLQYEFIDTQSLFNEIKNIFSLKTSQKNLELIIELDNNIPPTIYIDEIRLKQILINLINNAIKFTDKGYVKIETKATNLNSINVQGKTENYINLIIEVTDTGIGISKEFRSKMFESFTQQDGQSTRKYGGTGLGLSITKKLVNLMQGTIQVESELNKGSKFIIEIKDVLISNDKLEVITAETIDVKNIKFKKATVLIVDDIEINRNYLTIALANKNLDIIEAVDGNDGWEKIKKFKPDLVLADLKMPILNGFELAKRIKSNKQYAHIPIAALSASVLKKDKIEIEKHKFNGFLFKPILLQDLFKLLIELLPVESHNTKPTEIPDWNTSSNKYASPESLYLLENELTEQWGKFKVKQPVNEVKKFANQLNQIAYKEKLEVLNNYANDLLFAMNSFDIALTLEYLQKYPEIIKQLKQQ